ncbi:MAG: hypothetical protein E2591_27140 [Achromobacter sp.]|uniref:hypothetical protein n=1 Tax=Achromobacter sp. TaxID=134375 RepID=UPI0012CB743C|nr:hypothetical protein [Achromobacter sp.]MPS81752.1 hypothetical protein [Achromobacter sp.]
MTTNKPAPTEETEFEQGKAAAPTKRRRGLAMRTVIGTAKVVSRPYLEAGKSMKRLRGTLRTLGRTMAMKPDLETDSNFIDAPDSASAFESLYRANGWTEPQLRQQRRAIVRAKFVALLLSIIFLSVSVFGVFTLRYLAYVPVAVIIIGLSITALGLSLFVHHAIYQAQIDERRLLSAREFFAHRDRWAFLFSS